MIVWQLTMKQKYQWYSIIYLAGYSDKLLHELMRKIKMSQLIEIKKIKIYIQKGDIFMKAKNNRYNRKLNTDSSQLGFSNYRLWFFGLLLHQL